LLTRQTSPALLLPALGDDVPMPRTGLAMLLLLQREQAEAREQRDERQGEGVSRLSGRIIAKLFIRHHSSTVKMPPPSLLKGRAKLAEFYSASLPPHTVAPGLPVNQEGAAARFCVPQSTTHGGPKSRLGNYRLGLWRAEESPRKPMVFANQVKKSNRTDFG
jgi:hypothetical protein